ncbi:MAG TPA: TonB-dependent receptor [Gammaproteobacteria bacterium]
MKKYLITDIRITCKHLLLTLLLVSSISMAQDEDEGLTQAAPPPTPPAAPRNVTEELLVTGSFIKGLTQENLASPLQSIDFNDIADLGAVRLADIINNLTINTGSENNTDAFTQNFTSGTSNINLRGLGVASTLVLLNNRRQTYSAFVTNKGENFVDTASLVPLIAIDRIEILKDGAASLYGSDAVAGVVNFHTRNDFDGAEIQLEYQSGDYGQQETIMGAIFGTGNDNTHIMAAVSLFDRSELTTEDKRLSAPGDDVSIAGFPGSFLVPTQPTGPSPVTTAVWTLAYDGNLNGTADFMEGLSATPPLIADPNCDEVAANGGTTSIPPANEPTGTAGVCSFDFGSFYSLVPQEERTQFYSHLTHRFSDTLDFDAEIAYANNNAERRNSPSFPIATLPGIPDYHPNNPFGVDVAFVGRVLATGAEALISEHESETLRFAAGLGGVFNNGWTWDVDTSYSKNDFVLTAKDTLNSEFQRALAGLGGASCSGNPADIGNPAAGCFFYNPFASPTPPFNANSSEMLDYVTGDFRIDAQAELTTLTGVVSGEWFELDGGSVGVAAGIQYRDEALEHDYDENANNENFMFLVGNPDFDANRDVSAIFSELSLPFSSSVTVQFSLRHENYGDDVDSTDPKLALLWRPNDNLSVRGSLSTSFRAPSLFQQYGVQTTLNEITTLAGTQFLAARAQANPADPLLPEEADVGNLGLTWISDSRSAEISLDYWTYDYDQVIIQQNPQAVHDAAFFGNDPQALSQIDFAGGVISPLTIERIHVYYDNASSLKTDGIDLGASFTVENFRLGAELTHILSYDLEDPQAGSVEGAGNRNFTNFGTSAPELRANIHLGWMNENHSVNTFARHISSYEDDANNNATIDAHTTFDLQYNYRFAPWGDNDEGMVLSIGGINVTDEDPPYVSTNGGFDSKVHDPRGALYYIRATIPL